MSHSINFQASCIISSAPASSQCADSPDGHVAEAGAARTRCVWVFWSRARLAPQLLEQLDALQSPVLLQVFRCDILFGRSSQA